MKINNWICNICGASSEDQNERNNSLKEHLKQQHLLDLEEYLHLVNDEQIGASRLHVKLLNYPNDITLPIISFLSQTWGPTFSLDEFIDLEIQGMLDIALEGKSLSTVLV